MAGAEATARGWDPRLAQVMTQRLLQLEALELRRIDVLYSIMAGAAAAAGKGLGYLY